MTAPAAVVSGDCAHEEWSATATYTAPDETDPPNTPWLVKLTMTCAGCGAPMLWSGPASVDVSPDRVTIMLPCEPCPPGERS